MTRYLRIVGHCLRGRWADARLRIDRILALVLSAGDARGQLGVLYLRTDQTNPAARTFRHCLESKHGAKWRWVIHRELARPIGRS